MKKLISLLLALILLCGVCSLAHGEEVTVQRAHFTSALPEGVWVADVEEASDMVVATGADFMMSFSQEIWDYALDEEALVYYLQVQEARYLSDKAELLDQQVFSLDGAPAVMACYHVVDGESEYWAQVALISQPQQGVYEFDAMSADAEMAELNAAREAFFVNFHWQVEEDEEALPVLTMEEMEPFASMPEREEDEDDAVRQYLHGFIFALPQETVSYEEVVSSARVDIYTDEDGFGYFLVMSAEEEIVDAAGCADLLKQFASIIQDDFKEEFGVKKLKEYTQISDDTYEVDGAPARQQIYHVIASSKAADGEFYSLTCIAYHPTLGTCTIVGRQPTLEQLENIMAELLNSISWYE